MDHSNLFFTFLGLLIGWLSVYVAHTLGWLQIRILLWEHNLNLAKTTPKIGTSVRLEDRQSHTHPVSTLVVVAKIYNEGDLAVSELKGNWKLSCSENTLNRSGSISVDHLGNSRPHEIETQLGGVPTWRDVRGSENIAIDFNIEFRYTGLPEDGEQTYRAHYRYNYSQKDFVKQD
jgi:hypothetical protein